MFFFFTIKDYSPFMAILVPSNNTFACGKNVNYKINYYRYVCIYIRLSINYRADNEETLHRGNPQ